MTNSQRTAPRHLLLWGAIAALLLLPLVAMQFTRQVSWDASDFAAAALLLVGAGGLYEIAARYLTGKRRLALGAALLVAVVLVWAQGAVGIV